MDVKRKARAVSGEIMTGNRATPEMAEGASAGNADIVDAEYEIVAHHGRTDANAFRSREGEENSIPGLDMLRGRQTQGRAQRGERGGPLFWAVGAMLVAAAFWFSGGHALLNGVSLFESDGPAPGLRIASLQSRIEKGNGRALLFVDGEAVNEAAATETVPTLSINVLDSQGRTTRYLLGTNDHRLAPGQHFAFSSRLIAPKGGVKSVSVTFEEQGE